MDPWTKLEITPDVERSPWVEIDPSTAIEAPIVRIGLLRNGTTTGRASVALAIPLPDGRVVLAQTTWRLFHTAARSLAASAIAQAEPQEP